MAQTDSRKTNSPPPERLVQAAMTRRCVQCRRPIRGADPYYCAECD